MSSWEETLKKLKGSLKERPRRTQEQREKDFEEFKKKKENEVVIL